MFSCEQLVKIDELVEKISKSPWSLCISRDKRRAQVVDASGRSVFGGSWVLTPEEAQEIITLREILPTLYKSLLTQESLVSTLADTILSLQEVFGELQKKEDTQAWAKKGSALVDALIIEKEN